MMHEAAKLRPVVIDESLTDLETLLLAREMGYTGVALKACKGQSHAMLMAAAAQKFGMFLCVQDLTCPGASLIHSAGIAARVPGNAGIEANARQFVPERERGLGGAVPGAVHHSRWRDEHRAAHRSGIGSRASPEMRYEPSRERGTGSTRRHEATGRFSATFACRQANIVELHAVHALRVELRTKPRVWL